MKAANIKVLKKELEYIENAKSHIEDIFSDEEDVISGKSDKWHESEAGERGRVIVDQLSSTVDSLDSAIDSLAGVLANAESK